MESYENYPYRLSDMVAGAITHGLGVLLAVVGLIVLVLSAIPTHNSKLIVSVVIFGASLILSYLSSTLYHCLVRTKAYQVFRVFDHSLIYLLIAGTYTPIVLNLLSPALGWALFIVVWSLAAIGIVSKSVALGKHPILSVVLYLAMGWLIVFFIVPLWHALPMYALMLLFAGGVCYSTGIAFFANDRIRYFHSIWHIFVLAGSIFHFFLILEYIAL